MEIDVVITWVDGKDPAHIAKRAKHVGPQTKGEAYAPGLWIQSDEVLYCLRSIGKFAPWVRRIWIVTDNQSPKLFDLNTSLRDRIEIVDHKVIFRGHEDKLPTFNSVSIEAALHRIPGLAERFIYFNDDFLLLAPCRPEDFFTPDGLVLRGTFVDSFETKGLHPQHRMNAAQIVGAKPGRIFKSAHVCHPVLKSIVEDFFRENPDLFERNISFRFRDSSQILMSTLVEHIAIKTGRALVRSGKDWHMIDPGNSPKGDFEAARRQLEKLLAPGIRLGCINNFANLVQTYPDAIYHLDRRFAFPEIAGS